MVRCPCSILSHHTLSYGSKYEVYFGFQLISKSALTQQLSVLRALVSVEQSVQFLFEWTRFHTGFCAHVSSGVLKINFLPEAEKCNYFFLLTSNCKSVFRYLTKCTIQMESYDIFAETVQIKRFLYLEETPKRSCFVCSRVITGLKGL